MPDRVLKPETEKGEVLSAAAGDFLPVLERPDVYLPVPTETCTVPPESRIVVYSDSRSAGADRFRLAQIRLKGLQAARKLKTLLITSPYPADGKTTVSLNLATALSERGKRPVLLLEADVFRPTVLEKLGMKPWPGLTECFENKCDPMLAIRRINPLGFYLLPAGSPMEDGNVLLQSEFMSQLLKGLIATSFSWILVDAPPTTPIAELLLLRAQSDATLLVARAGQTPREAIDEATQHLGRDHVVGIILNGVEGLDRVYSHYYGYKKPDTRTTTQRPKGTPGLGLKTRGT
jgi:receptor protein-tyrosine kinase